MKKLFVLGLLLLAGCGSSQKYDGVCITPDMAALQLRGVEVHNIRVGLYEITLPNKLKILASVNSCVFITSDAK